MSLAPIKDASMTTSPIDGVPLPDIAPDAISIADASVATNTKSVKSSSTLSKKIVGRSARKTDKGAFILNESSSSSSVREYAGGTIAWSVLSVSYDALDYAGFLYFLVMANIHSAKKRFWCVLLDG